MVAAGNPQGLFLVPPGGLRPERLTTPDSAKSERHGYPSHLPGGEAVLFTLRHTTTEAEVDRAVAAFAESVAALRAMSPLTP